MNALSTFNFNTSAIRVVTIDGNPWFVAVDVYRALQLAQWGGILNPLDPSEKTLRGRTSVGLGAGRDVWLISESGLYKLVMRSDKPQARPFQDWVTKVVLPAIRKDGGYIVGEEKVATGQMSEDELVFRAMEVMKRKIERLSSENAAMSRELNEITVDEFRALKHAYWPHGFKVRIGQRSSEQRCQRERGSHRGNSPFMVSDQARTILRLNIPTHRWLARLIGTVNIGADRLGNVPATPIP